MESMFCHLKFICEKTLNGFYILEIKYTRQKSFTIRFKMTKIIINISLNVPVLYCTYAYSF